MQAGKVIVGLSVVSIMIVAGLVRVLPSVFVKLTMSSGVQAGMVMKLSEYGDVAVSISKLTNF